MIGSSSLRVEARKSSYKSYKAKSYKSKSYKAPKSTASKSYKSKTTNSESVKVKGYTKKNGTKVRPHSRSQPDNIKWNNYGKASSSQRKEWKDLNELPSYKNDYDNDGLPNRIDLDDDNDSIHDDLDPNPYGKSR